MLGDEIRWQPWLYQFLFIVFAILVNKRKPSYAINIIILILSSTYFFSGLQKINGGFLQNVWINLVLIRFLHLPIAITNSRFVHYAGLIIPLFEVLAGIFVLLPKQRKLFAFFPISMHLFVLLFLGPLGIQYNAIVLPWNAAMAVFIYVLFIANNNTFVFARTIYHWNILIAFAWMVLPIAGMFGYWDKYFSSSLYSGKNHNMKIYLADTTAIPIELAPYVLYSKKGFQNIHKVISLHGWSMQELNVPVPPEKRIYKSIEISFQKKYSYLHPVFVSY